MRPKTLSEIVGQDNVKCVLQTLIKSAEKTNDPVPHILMSGSAGLGKTSIAQSLANDINSGFFSLNCSTVNKPEKIFNILQEVNRGDVLFLDEIHALSKKICESLYTILEDFCYYEEGYKIEIPRITVIGASTEIGRLPLPLKSRFKFTANLREYSDDELIQVCKQVFEEKNFKLNNSLAKIIAKTCRGVPRTMVSRAEWIYAYMVGNELKVVSQKNLIDIIALQGVNEDGLEDHDLHYLKILFNSNNLSLDGLSSKMNMDKENIKNIVEPYLIKLGLIDIKQGRGRILTRKGKDYIKKLNEKDSNENI